MKNVYKISNIAVFLSICVLCSVFFAIGCTGSGGGIGALGFLGGGTNEETNTTGDGGGQTVSGAKTLEITGMVGAAAPALASPALLSPSLASDSTAPVDFSAKTTISVVDLTETPISGATASYIGTSGFRALVPLGESSSHFMLLVKNKAGAPLYKKLMGKSPKAADVSVSVLRVSNVRVNEDATARSVILLGSRTRIPETVIATGDMTGKTKFESDVDATLNDPDGTKFISPLKTAVTTVAKTLDSNNAAVANIKNTYLNSVTNLLSSYVAVAQARESDDSLRSLITVRPVILIGATTIDSSTEQSSITSTVSSIAAELKQQVALPALTPNGGSFTSSQQVTIACATAGATIMYTINGTLPSQINGTAYSGPLNVSSDVTVKAMAYKSGMTDSDIVSASFRIGTQAVQIVSTPSISPAAGTYSAAQSVTVTCATSGATIRYTTDGSTPTQSAGTVYAGAFTVSSSATVKAIAYKTGMTDSAVASAAYVIQQQVQTVATPVISPNAGTYSSSQAVSITCGTSGATIRYTTDGSTPSQSAGTVYAGTFTVSSTATVKAIAYKTGMADSAVASSTFTILTPVSTPSITPAAGTYSSAQSVTITCATSGATIRYTTDGSAPSQSAGTVYTGAFTVSSTATVRAIAYKSGMSDSAVASCAYTILQAVATPLISPAAGAISASQAISITCATSGATIRYTTDGSAPSQSNGTVYSGTFTISSATTVKAIAYKSGMTDSAVASTAYTIMSPVSAPTFSVSDGTYSSAQSVTISCATSGATIRYTTDGSAPSQSNGTVYSAAVSVAVNTTLKAIAYKSGMTDSSVATAVYYIRAAAPAFSVSDGTYSSAQSVTISCATSGATIRYTTDGSAPSQSNGTVYSGAISVAVNTTLKAIAYKSGMADSTVATASYSIKVAVPTFSPAANTYTEAQNVTISCATSGATIKYTTDGSTPSQTVGTTYSSAINVAATTTIKAIAYKSGMTDSDVTASVYIISIFTLTSTAFSEGGVLPDKYSREAGGQNVSPPLAWTGVPASAQSLMVVCIDGNGTPSFSTKSYWMIYNIPPTATGLAEAIAVNESVTAGVLPSGTATQSANMYTNRKGYDGPDLTPGTQDGVNFAVIALNLSSLPANTSLISLYTTYQGNIVGQAKLSATFTGK